MKDQDAEELVEKLKILAEKISNDGNDWSITLNRKPLEDKDIKQLERFYGHKLLELIMFGGLGVTNIILSFAPEPIGYPFALISGIAILVLLYLRWW